MASIKFIYFEGCPNAQKVRALLNQMKISFQEINQDKLPENDFYKAYTSPSVLKGDEVVFGSKTDGAGGCTFSLSEIDQLHARLKEPDKKKAGIFSTIGSIGSALTVGLCPICIPAIGAFLSAIGLGFLVEEVFLFPLLLVFLGITVGGLLWSYFKEHQVIWPLLGGILMALSLYLGRYVYFNSLINNILMYGGIVGIIAMSFWNLRLRKKAGCQSCAIDS